MREMRRSTFFRKLVATNLRAALALRAAFLLQAGFMLLNNLFFFVTWWIFFERFEEVRGWTLRDMASLYGVVTGAFGTTVIVFGGIRDIAERVANGELDAYLTLPADPLIHLAGSRSIASGWGDLASAPVFLLLLGSSAPGDIPFFLIGMACATVVFASTGVLIHSLAFWLGRIDSVARQIWDLTLLFSLYPRTIFSGALQVVLFTLIPAGFVGHLPVELVRRPSALLLVSVVAAALFYAALAWWIFRIGLRRYASGSRFVARA